MDSDEALQIKAVLDDTAKFGEVSKAAFDSADTNGSGGISKDEMTLIMNEIAAGMGVKPPTEKEIADKLTLLGIHLDPSGDIDLDGFRIFVRYLLEQISK
ncbi:MAG: hypothetical protein WCO45_02655 [Pseudanabaena sp. ELA607]|jgi:Ca2+-binding EF-hand superfamily protein